MDLHASMGRTREPKRLRTDASALVATCAGLHSRLAARRITQFLDRELAGRGVSTAQLGLLAQIAAASDDTLGALAQRTGLDPSTVSRNLRALEGDGLVEIAVAEWCGSRRRVRGGACPAAVERDRDTHPRVRMWGTPPKVLSGAGITSVRHERQSGR
jgi:DNA-binding transcriptional ArsR family regulator